MQIAAYRDSELISTIEDLLSKANNPEQLTVCICRQFHPDDGFDNLDIYRNDSRFKIIDVNYQQSKGVCWARNLIQQLYSGETYTLQVDSHSRFSIGWDGEMCNMIQLLQAKGIKKPLLTGYPAAYEPGNEDAINYTTPPLQMILSHFSSEGIPMCESEPIPGGNSLNEPVPARFYSAGFCFTLGSFCQDVKHDPDIYFIGEEISITIRAFTQGYDLFHPHKMLVWHYYIRSSSIKHWDNDNEWRLKNQLSFRKIRLMLGISDEKNSTIEYGLGRIRTLTEYEIYSGIDLLSTSIRQEVVDKNFPVLNNKKIKYDCWYTDLKNSYQLEIEIDLEIFLIFDFLVFTAYDIDSVLVHQENVPKKNVRFEAKSSLIKLKFYIFSNNVPVLWRVKFMNQQGGLLQKIKRRTYFEAEQRKINSCNI